MKKLAFNAQALMWGKQRRSISSAGLDQRTRISLADTKNASSGHWIPAFAVVRHLGNDDTGITQNVEPPDHITNQLEYYR